MSKTHATREAWLTAALPALCKILRAAGAPDFPAPLISMGLPSKGALSAKRKRIGECWSEKAVGAEKRCAIFISPVLDDPVRVLDVYLHELIHAAIGTKEGHGPKFKAVATACGFTGKMRSTEPTPELAGKLKSLADDLGPFPHEALKNFRAPEKKQTTRMRLYVCDACGQKIRCASDTLVASHACEEGEGGVFTLSDSPNLAPAPKAKSKAKPVPPANDPTRF